MKEMNTLTLEGESFEVVDKKGREEALKKNQGKENANKILFVGPDGNTVPTPIPIDDTLSVSGAAADAKVVGDEINELKKQKNIHYNSVAEMKSNKSLAIGKKVTTSGYYTSYDGGGGTYLIREKLDGDLDNGGTIHVIDNLVAELIVDGIINIKQFGAKGDGISDDTMPCNNCFAQTKCRNIYMPTGTYIVQYIEFKLGFKLIGDGSDRTVIKRIDGYDCINFDLSKSKPNLLGNTDYNYTTKESVSIKGICFDGNDKKALISTTEALKNMFNSVHLYYLNHLEVEKCCFINSISDGLFIGGITTANIKNCEFKDIGFNQSVKPKSRNGITAFGRYYNRHAEVKNIIEPTDVYISNCIFNHSDDMGISCQNIRVFSVKNCIFSDMKTNALELFANSSSTTSFSNAWDSQIEVLSNTFNDCGISFSEPSKGYKTNIVIEDNTIKTKTDGRIGLTASLIQDASLTIQDNKIDSSQLYINSFKNVYIYRNDIKYNKNTDYTGGVALLSCAKIEVKDNKIDYIGQVDIPTKTGIYIYNPADDVSIIENIIKCSDNVGRGIWFKTTDIEKYTSNNIKISNNVVLGVSSGIWVESYSKDVLEINNNILNIPESGKFCIQCTSLSKKPLKTISVNNVLLNNTTVNLRGETIKEDNF